MRYLYSTLLFLHFPGTVGYKNQQLLIVCNILSNILLCKQQLWIRQTTIVEFFEYLMLKSNLTAIAITYSPYCLLSLSELSSDAKLRKDKMKE